jgi:ribose 1,5-bisphosphokinase
MSFSETQALPLCLGARFNNQSFTLRQRQRSDLNRWFGIRARFGPNSPYLSLLNPSVFALWLCGTAFVQQAPDQSVRQPLREPYVENGEQPTMDDNASRRCKPHEPPRPLGPGRLFLVVGPSGAGKDTLLRHAQLMLQHDPDIAFVRRIVTRPPSAAEDHHSLSPDDFWTAARQGAFAFSWSAHGLSYAIPLSIQTDIAAGRRVVCNVSRAVVPDARARYERAVVVLVTAPDDVLRARLMARDRASDIDIAARLSRASWFTPTLCPDHVIVNIGSVDRAAAELAALVRGVPT